LRSKRKVDGGEHDECADIIARNPDVDFKAGLSGVEVDHEVHAGTFWDANLDNYPRTYAENFGGRLGNIIISIRYRIVGLSSREWANGPRFYKPDYYTDTLRRNWYVAGNTAIVRARVEKVIDVVPVK